MKRTTLLRRLRELYPGIAEKELFAKILCGEVAVDGATLRRPAEQIPADAAIAFVSRRRFVSRGGEKLDGVLERWGLRVAGLSFLDAGASTGGFTDCLLQRGARVVVAVERGTNQLDFRLRRDPRVTLLERTNIMDLTCEQLPLRPEAAVADLSLRSLRLAAAHILSLLLPGGWLIALVKPQYERGGSVPPADAGIIRGRRETLGILRSLLLDLAAEGLAVLRAAPSVLPGARGNREFFFEIRRAGDSGGVDRRAPALPEGLEALVAEAFPG